MSKQLRTGVRLRSRVLFALGLAVACSGDDGNRPGSLGELSGTAAYSTPLAGATVTVRQYYQDAETITIATTTTRDDGTWGPVDTSTYAGDFLITVTGGHYTEASGGVVTLDASAVLHTPVQGVETAEKRTDVAVTPLTELVWQLGKARLAGHEDADYAAAVEHARALLSAHVGFDPLTTTIAPLTVATALTEPAKHALVLAGLSELAATAAADRGVSVQAINTRVVTTQLVLDASSPEARLDGNGATVLCLATACPLPTNCTAEGPGCYTSASVYSNTLRARLGAAVLIWLQRPQNGTRLGRSDVLSWVTHLKDSNDPMLFGGDPPEELSSMGPVVTWVAPSEGAPVTGQAAIEVTATDALGVASITVQAATDPPSQLTDTDPAADRFAATFSTVGLPEGPIELIATGRNVDGLETMEPRTISVNNVPGGVLDGVVVKGPVGGATVRAFQYENGVRGAELGRGTTTSDGRFTAVSLAEGYNGAVLIEAGEGGTYGEEAGPATVVLDVSDRLRTVIPAYQDGGSLTSVVVSPLTEFAVTYFEYLRSAHVGGATLDAQWATAHAAIEAHFGVNDILRSAPPPLPTVTSTNSVTNYSLVLLGLSELAYRASNAGGGDGGTFGSAMNALRVVRVLDQDLADGCWDGTAAGTPLDFGGTQHVGPRATRLDLANALVANEQSPTRDATPGISDVADLIGLLDNLARGGGNSAIGSCTSPVAGHLNPDNGSAFDQVGPTIDWVTAPASGAAIRLGVPIVATATDTFDAAPDLVMLLPSGTLDADGADRILSTTINTQTLPDGPLEVKLRATDASTNSTTESRFYTVDNTAPVITFTGGLVDGNWYAGPVTVSFTVSEPTTTTVTVDGSPSSQGAMISSEGQHVIAVTSTDAAGNPATRSITIYIDLTAPTIAVTGPPGAWVRQSVSFTAIADDTMKQYGSLSSDLTVAATGPTGAAVTPVTLQPTVLANGQRQLVATFDTAAISAAVGDGMLSVRFSVTDRVGHVTNSSSETRTIDNTPPTVTLAAVRNQAGAMIPGFVNESTATITGTVPTGGSPVTVTINATPGGMGTVSPNASGGFAFTTGALPEGTVSVAATAADAAGNTATAAPLAFVVDRTGPTLTFAQSTAFDERGCASTITVNTTPGMSYGAIGPSPVNYACSGATVRRLDNATTATEVGKFTNRMTSTPADNPLVWLPTANDGTGGVGLDVTPSTIQFEVFRTATFPVGNWANAVGLTVNNGLVSGTVYATAAQWPELTTYTAPFSIIVRAQDRLGNMSASPTIITWTNRPLAPPVWIRYVGLANASDATLGTFSLFRHALTPTASQVGLAPAMSSGGLYNDAPRGLFEYEIWNPHAQAINVGFLLPAFSGGTFTSEVRQVNPYINATNGIVNNPANGFCGWNASTVSFRMSGGTAPFTCGSGTTCTCFTGASPEPTDVAYPTSGALTNAQLMFAAFNANGASPTRLAAQSLTATVSGYPFYEFAVPAAPSATLASHVRVLVALPNLDLWSPASDPSVDAVQESDGVGSETHYWEIGSTRLAPILTATFYERWADCRSTDGAGHCTAVHARRRLRATVQADMSVPANVLKPWVRSRAAFTAAAGVEEIPAAGVKDNDLPGLRAQAAATWLNCENTMSACPTIPDMSNSPPF